MQVLLKPDTPEHLKIMQRDDLPDTCHGGVQAVEHVFPKILPNTFVGLMAALLLRVLWERCSRTGANRFGAGDAQWSLDYDYPHSVGPAWLWGLQRGGESMPQDMADKLLDILLAHKLISKDGDVFRFNDDLSARLLHAQAAWYVLCQKSKAA